MNKGDVIKVKVEMSTNLLINGGFRLVCSETGQMSKLKKGGNDSNVSMVQMGSTSPSFLLQEMIFNISSLIIFDTMIIYKRSKVLEKKCVGSTRHDPF